MHTEETKDAQEGKKEAKRTPAQSETDERPAEVLVRMYKQLDGGAPAVGDGDVVGL